MIPADFRPPIPPPGHDPDNTLFGLKATHYNFIKLELVSKISSHRQSRFQTRWVKICQKREGT